MNQFLTFFLLKQTGNKQDSSAFHMSQTASTNCHTPRIDKSVDDDDDDDGQY